MVVFAEQRVRVPQNVVERGDADVALPIFVYRDAVVVDNKDADDGENRQRDNRGMAREEGGESRD